jgi:tRNA A-37 threonylcarbamoyl transferase component Bud32
MQAETTTFDREQLLDEVVTAYLKEAQAGRMPEPAAWLDRYPELAQELTEFFADRASVERLAAPLRSVAPVPPAPGHFGDYELLEEIARGGMGVVYRARQRSLNREVALKMVLADRLASPAERERFRREAEAAAHLDHPNIVPVYEVGDHAGWPFFSMKLIPGVDLRQTLAAEPGRHDARLLRNVIQQSANVARAVHHAHERGILHRDLKPSNILIDAEGQAHVADFGLAKRVEGDSATTKSGAITGTPSYMSPEQAAAMPTLTTAVDVYGLGAILYEVLTGRPPFCADTPLDTLVQVRSQEPARPRTLNPKVDRDLETICLKCLEKEPAKRYGSAEALADDLDRWQNSEPIAARPASTWERGLKWARRRPAVASLAGGMLGVALCAVVFLLWGLQQEWHAQQAAEGKAKAEARAIQKVAEAETQKAKEADHRAREFDARLSLKRGSTWCERGQVEHGLLWFARGLAVAPDDAADLQKALRSQVGGWLPQIHPLELVLRHEEEVSSARFSPDGKMIVTCADNNKIVRLWDAATGKPIGEPFRHAAVIRYAVNADGTRLVTVDRE